MIAEILSIGDELLRGEIVDSNKSFLSDALLRIDIPTRFQTSVCDDPEDMTDAFVRAAERSDVVLVSGGLGPTRDDLTIEVLARTFGQELVLHEPSLEAMRAFFARFGREMAPNNEKQAWLPQGGEALPNPVGTAPGCLLEAGGALFFCMPGVPRELIQMMDEQVLPRLRVRAQAEGGGVTRVALLRTFGMGESTLDNELQDLAHDDGLTLGFRTAFPDNYLRPMAHGRNEAEAAERLAKLVDAIRRRLGSLIYGEGDETLEQVVVGALAAAGRTLATAESCTGGLVAQRLTGVPGASAVFRGGVVAYANEAKRDLLGVSEELLEAHGAVSGPVARAMAEGARKRFGADYAISTTGISGPDGGTDAKPVGLVFVGWSSQDEDVAEELLFPLDRARHRMVTSQVALDWVRRSLAGEPRVSPRYLGSRRS